MSYQEFIQRKAQLDSYSGFEPLWMPDFLFDFQQSLVDWSIRKGKAALFEDCGLGKALASDTPVLTPTGFVPIASLHIGDSVIGSNGKSTQVLGVFPQGEREGFEVVFSDESSLVCDLEHVWTTRTKSPQHRQWKNRTLGEMVKLGIGGCRGERYGRWFIPMVQPVEFSENELPLHPYVLGCLLGDGGISGRAVILTSADSELIETVRGMLPNGMTITKKRYSKYDYSIGRDGLLSGMAGGHHRNQVASSLEELGLMGTKSDTKFIPDCYKFAAADTRLWLLQGLLTLTAACG